MHTNSGKSESESLAQNMGKNKYFVEVSLREDSREVLKRQVGFGATCRQIAQKDHPVNSRDNQDTASFISDLS